MTVRILLLSTLLYCTVPAAFAQGRVYRDRVEPQWNVSGTQFWYSNRLPEDGREFWLVDAEQGSRRPAFDAEAVAQAFSRQLSQEMDPRQLPVDSLEFAAAAETLVLVGKNGRFLWNTAQSSLTPLPQDAATALRLFLPPRPSQGSSDSTELEIHNQLDQPVSLIWISTAGEERHYADVAPGASHRQHSWAGHVWMLRVEDSGNSGCFRVPADGISVTVTRELLTSVERQPRGGRRNRQPGAENPVSPDAHWQPFVRENNLWLKNLQDESEQQLTNSGTAEWTFRRDAQRARSVGMNFDLQDFPDHVSNCRWSPDSEYLLAWQTTQVTETRVHYVESTPGDQLQPRLHSYPYLKPGAEIPVATPHLFRISDATHIPVSTDLFPNPWSLEFQRWSADGSRCWLMYNERGHQRIRLLEITVDDGKVRTVIDEYSPTFIHYSAEGKTELRWLSDEQAIWTSERSGWNHLYSIDLQHGKVAHPITTGEWNVRRIDRIDMEAGLIWFTAVGIIAGQDPGFEHACRVRLDGSELRVLTEGDGFHQIQWSPDRRWFIDRWSRVDLPPVSDLRSADGALVCRLETADASELLTDGRTLPIRFTAAGRDGHTPIWGIIHLPDDFSPDRSWPVVENIYAGPHDYHVPKEFRSVWGHQRQIANSGFIVVQIDGMGTAWRSREFHNVCWQNLKDAGFPDRIAWMQAAAQAFDWLDLSRVGIYGGSAGGQNAMAALLWHGDFYRAAVADCGCHDNRMDKIWWNEQWLGLPRNDIYERNSNTEHAHLLQGRLMLVVGELDRNVDPATTMQVARRLIQAGKDFDLVVVPGAGHGACETPWASRKRIEFFRTALGQPEPRAATVQAVPD